VKITVTNVGDTKVTWAHGGCSSVGTMGGVSRVAWRLGEEQPGNRGRFKVYALGGPVYSGAPRRFASFSFVPEDRVGRGSYGCADVGIDETIRPGESRRETRWWSGFTDLNRALPITGPALLTAHAGAYWRGQPPERLADAINFEIDIEARIDSPDEGQRKSPGEAIDGALRDEVFGNYVDYWARGTGDEIAWYQADREVREVAMLDSADPERPLVRGVEVDPDGGWVIRPLLREWDREVDGYPGP
jgi:hypothetical protein